MDKTQPDNQSETPSRESSRTMRIDLTPDMLGEKRAGLLPASAPRRPTIRVTKAKTVSSMVGDSDFQSSCKTCMTAR